MSEQRPISPVQSIDAGLDSSPPERADVSLPPGVKPKRLTEAHLIPQLIPISTSMPPMGESQTPMLSDWKSRRKKIVPG